MDATAMQRDGVITHADVEAELLRLPLTPQASTLFGRAVCRVSRLEWRIDGGAPCSRAVSIDQLMSRQVAV
jgi:hypothetical protein